MKIFRITITLISLITVGSAVAETRSPVTVQLPGLTVHHLGDGANYSEQIQLDMLDHNQFWNISCDYEIQETNNAKSPSISNPFSIEIFPPRTGQLSVTGYNSNAITTPHGKLKVNMYSFYHRDTFVLSPNSIGFHNNDKTGNFVISNCVATQD